MPVPHGYERALVTGATSGIGLATAHRLGRDGIEIGVLAEDPSAVQATVSELSAEGVRAFAATADLSRPEQVRGLIGRLEAEHGPVDVLINCAGIGLQAAILEMREGDLRLLFEVNFFAMALLSQQALAAMSRRGRGHIVNVSSAAARRALPGLAVYGASKAAMHAFSQALRVEARPHGIHVTELLPMSVRTPFFANARNRSDRPYEVGSFSTTPEAVADRIWHAILHPVPEVYTSALSRFVLALDAVNPRWFEAILAARERRTGA